MGSKESSSGSDSDSDSSSSDSSSGSGAPSDPGSKTPADDPGSGTPAVDPVLDPPLADTSLPSLLSHAWPPEGLRDDQGSVVFTYIPTAHPSSRDKWPVWWVKCTLHIDAKHTCGRQRTCGSNTDEARGICYRRLLVWVLEGGLLANWEAHKDVHSKPIPKRDLASVEELQSQVLPMYAAFDAARATDSADGAPAPKRRRRGKTQP